MKHSRAVNAACPYASNEELEWLEGAAQENRVVNIVIIGAGPGVMPLAILEATDRDINLFVIEIDTFQWMNAHLKQAGLERDARVIRILGDSAVVGLTLWRSAADYEQWIDLLVIDGDHSFEGVMWDILAWCPQVKEGGYVFFHDYTGNLQNEQTGVAEAIQQNLEPRFRVLTEIGISRIYHSD